MAHEDLMQQLPPDVERVDVLGPFFVRANRGSFSVVVLTSVLVTCGGEESRQVAMAFARKLNGVWNAHFDREHQPEESSK